MKTTRQPTTQLRLAWEADETRVWRALDALQRQQVTEQLATLWIHVMERKQVTSKDEDSSSANSQEKLS